MPFRKICIIHLNQIGDLVFSLPLLKALKDNDPDATIHSIVRPYLADLLKDSPYVDELILRPSGVRNTISLLKLVRRNKYDLLISLSNSWEGFLLTVLSKAGLKAGFSGSVWNFGLDIREKVEGHHSWYNNRKLLRRLDIKITQDNYTGLLVLPPNPTVPMNFPEKYAVCSPGTSARRTVKAWEEEKFADLIIRLEEKYGMKSVLVGSKENKQVNETIISLIERKRKSNLNSIIDLTGKVELKDLCSILKNATLFVGVDSGIMHLSSAFDIPVVGLFGPTDPFYVGPQNSRSIVIQKKEIKCVPCYLKGCKDRTCMKRIEVAEVITACGQVLGNVWSKNQSGRLDLNQ